MNLCLVSTSGLSAHSTVTYLPLPGFCQLMQPTVLNLLGTSYGAVAQMGEEEVIRLIELTWPTAGSSARRAIATLLRQRGLDRHIPSQPS